MKKYYAAFITLIAFQAFAQEVTLDATFGTQGKVVTALGSGNSTANAVAVQPDGKFLVAGTYLSAGGENDYALARFNSDGSLDAAFGTEGRVVTNFLEINNDYNYIHSIHLTADGKIIVLGATGTPGFFPKVALVRYNTDGSIDTGFGNNGKIVSNLAPLAAYSNKLLFMPDGKFIITALKFYNNDPDYYIGIERYTQDGIIDASFGTDGQVVTAFGPGKSYPESMALTPDGKFVIAGTYTQTNNPKMAVARFNANGSLDTAFDGDGKAIANFGAGSYGEGMQVTVGTDGKIMVAGMVYTLARNFGVVRYNTNGSLDTTFDTDGMAISPYADTDDYNLINTVTRQPDGKYIVMAKCVNYMFTASDFVIRRYNADAAIDSTFGTNGKVMTTFNTGLNEAQCAVALPNGKIFVAGKSIPADYSYVDFGIARYNANGTLDTTLDGDGKVTLAFEKGNDELVKLLVLPNDKLLAVGTSGYRQANNAIRKDIVLSKYNSNGSPDATFGNGGKVTSVFGENINTVMAAALQPDGKIVVSNMYYNYTEYYSHYEIIRYNADGTPDASFGTGGKASVAFSVDAIAFGAGGKIIIAGENYTDSSNTASAFFISRYNANGTLDTTFDSDGTAVVPKGTVPFGRVSLILQPDNKIVVSGTASYPDLYAGAPALVAARCNANGSVDTTFGVNGVLNALMVGDVYFAHGSFLQPDGTILIAGRSFGSSVYFTTIKLTANGTIDTAYGTDGAASAFLQEYREINSIVPQPDGKLLVAFSKYNFPAGSYDFKTMRFNTDGTYDADFGGMDGLTASFYNGYDEAFSIGLQSDNKIVVAGSTHNGISKDFALTRYTNNITAGTGYNAGAGANVVIYPNPVKNVVTIAAGKALDIVDYRITDMLGKVVYKNTGSHLQVDTHNFSAGVYTISINTNKGIVNKKFIKE